jgi:hypothetical protein
VDSAILHFQFPHPGADSSEAEVIDAIRNYGFDSNNDRLSASVKLQVHGTRNDKQTGNEYNEIKDVR